MVGANYAHQMSGTIFTMNTCMMDVNTNGTYFRKTEKSLSANKWEVDITNMIMRIPEISPPYFTDTFTLSSRIFNLLPGTTDKKKGQKKIIVPSFHDVSARNRVGLLFARKLI